MAPLALLPMLGLAGSTSAHVGSASRRAGSTSAHARARIPTGQVAKTWVLRRRLSAPGLYDVRLRIASPSGLKREYVEIFAPRVRRRTVLATRRRSQVNLRVRIVNRSLTVRVVGSRLAPRASASVSAIRLEAPRRPGAQRFTNPPQQSRSETSAQPNGAAAQPRAPMPTGDPPGWHRVFADDFNGSTLDPNLWRKYSGQPGGDPGGWWDPSHVSVSNGMLVLSGYRDPADGGKWTTGGVSSSPGLVQTYGKYLVRFRFDSGVGIAHAILLWPADDGWPPEVDFSEDNGSARQTNYATLHYGSNDTQIQRAVPVDLTSWHTLGVEWTPGQLVYTLDGQSWATVSSPAVPSSPMVLDIQTQAWACGTSTWEKCPNSTTPSHVNLYVDWVVAYARS